MFCCLVSRPEGGIILPSHNKNHDTHTDVTYLYLCQRRFHLGSEFVAGLGGGVVFSYPVIIKSMTHSREDIHGLLFIMNN